MLQEESIRKGTAIAIYALIIAGFAISTIQAEDVTTIKITDKVLLKNTKRFGLNIGGHGAKALKRRIRVNFEGSIHRRDVIAGPGCTDTKITTFMAGDWPELINSKGGGTYTILSGPQQGMIGKIISGKVEEPRWRYPSTLTRMESFYSFTLEKPIAPLRWRDGVRLEVKHIKDGALGGGDIWPAKIGSFSRDTPPGSWGYSSLEFSPKDKNGVLIKAGGLPETSPVVICSFWAKGVDSGTTLTIGKYGEKGAPPLETIKLTNEWKKYSFKWNYVGKKAWIQLKTTAATRIDDISVDIEGYKNPTPFGDRLYQLLKDINPGIIRSLQMSGGDVENFLRPKLQRYAATKEAKSSGSNYGYSNNDYYMLCEQLGAEPWYNLPGTVTKEGVLKYMEYIGAPADVGMAKIRADYGHPKPWTETLKAIHVEFGNEIWNNASHYRACGYNGPDHWESIIKAAKASPYYKPNVIFHVGGRRYAMGEGPRGSKEEAEGRSIKGRKTVAENVPSADRYTWAPYILSALDDKIIKTLGDDQGLLKYAFACAIDNALNTAGGRGEMFRAQEEIDAAGSKGSLSIYEINHHLTFGGFARFDKKKDTLEDWALKVKVRERNMIMATLGGGVNVINAMLMHLKYNNAIDQCYFCYRGSAGDFDTSISVFSTHHADNADGSFRYNAKMKAMTAVNKVLGGDLLETVHSGANPVFSSFSRRALKPVDDLPILWSYAFKDGDKHSLIVVNQDLDNAQKIKVEHSGKGLNAMQYLVTADKFSDHNRQEEKVKIIEKKIGTLKSGTALEIPPCSILVVSWK